MPEQSIDLLKFVSGVGEATIANFRAAGYRTLDDVRGVGQEQLKAVPGVGDATAEAILDFLDNPMLDDPVQAYRHRQQTRRNIPEAGIAGVGRVEDHPATRYFYDPHLDPVLRFDQTGGADDLPPLLAEARRRSLTAEETKQLAEALRNHQPWLEWAGKREKRWFDVDPVALHIHERVSAEAIIAATKRRPIQPSLFADPEMEFREAVKFYEHDVDWSNRLILGDSLEVMHSLAKREDLAGKVQMIYVDPPYGISFSSNFQPEIGERSVKDRESDLTREPEQVKAYRDTWKLGIHSYLSYLRDRLLVAQELLTDSGSIFVQIGTENLHLVRMLLDEVFGRENFVSVIPFIKSSGTSSPEARTLVISSVSDFVLWYARDRQQVKYHQLYVDKSEGKSFEASYSRIEFPNGQRGGYDDSIEYPETARLFTLSDLTAQKPTTVYDFEFRGRVYAPGSRGWRTTKEGMQRLVEANRVEPVGNLIRYVQYADDYPIIPLNNFWEDTGIAGYSAADRKIYVVQTATKVIQRCLLMTTDPGDLVLDPTCGSGTAAYVAEQWGRRWIAIDTSRVAVALARQRVLTSEFDYYQLKEPSRGVSGDFQYENAAHITLRSIAQNLALDPIFDRWNPILDDKLEALNLTLMEHATPEIRTKLKTKLVAKERAEGKRAITEADERRWWLPEEQWEHWEVPFNADPDWPEPLQRALEAYRKAWRQKMDEVNETIAASAPHEELVDQPEVVKGVVRVSGPFTVEGVQPAEEYLDVETPIAGAPEDLEAFDAMEQTALDPVNSEAYLEKMIRLLRKDGVRFPDNQEVQFEELEPLTGDVLHAEGRWQANGQEHRVAVSFGPQYGPITAAQVEQALRAAYRRGYDDVVFAGFSFDGMAQAQIQEDQALGGDLQAHMAHIRPDVNMGDLLKDTPGSQLFTVFGWPRVRLEQRDDGDYVVHMEGVDVYDPVTNALRPTKATKVAAWFLDHDYNGRTFNIGQAFFPDKSAWKKLKRALKTVVDEERFAAFSSTTSLPFPAGEHGRAAVKVIDPRGNEVMKIVRLNGEATY